MPIMDCPACGAQLTPGARFCAACGTPAPSGCSGCGLELPSGARFCPACGTPVADGTTVAPEGAAAGRDRGRERKTATLLFADIVGFTSLNESHDPELVSARTGSLFERLSREVERYEGTIEKFAGDAMLAVFGVPAAHEDDPERAVRAAIEMQEVVAALAADAGEGPALRLRIGIDTGEVLVDQTRAASERDLFVTGDAVNTASRLQASAEPGTVVVGPSTYAATRDAVDYEELSTARAEGQGRAGRGLASRRGQGRAGWSPCAPGTRITAGRAHARAGAAQGDREPRRRRWSAAPRHRHRQCRRGQEPPDLGAGEVPRRPARRLSLAQGPLPGLLGSQLRTHRRRGQGRRAHL